MSAGMNSSADGFRLTSGLINMNAAYTVMGWFRLSADMNNYNCLFAVSYNDSQYDFIGTWDDGTTLLAEIANAGVWDDIGTANMGDLNWHHVAFVRESTTTARLYFDGVLNATSTNNVGSRVAAAYMDIGTWAISSADYLTGEVFAVKAWSEALTLDEIKSEMYTIAPRRATGLYGFWPVMPGSGERTRDYSGNGHNWTESGTIDDTDHPSISWGAASWLVPYVLIGGTTYNQDVTGAIGSTAALLRQATLVRAGALSSAGAAIRRTDHGLAGATGSTGGLLKQAGKATAGEMSSAGAVTSIRTILKALAGALSSAGAIIRRTDRSLAGATELAGNLLKRAGKATAGGIASIGAVRRLTGKTLSGILAISGSAFRATLKALSGVLTSAGAGISSGAARFAWFYRNYVMRRRE